MSSVPQQRSQLNLTQFLKRVLDYVGTYAGLLYLAVICLGATVFMWLGFGLMPNKHKRAWTQAGISRLFRCYLRPLHWLGLMRVDTSGIAGLAAKGPIVVAPNHPALIDAVLLLAHMPRAICFMKPSILRNPMFGPGAMQAGFIATGEPHAMAKSAVAALNEGQQLLIFPESTRTTQQPVNELSKMFALVAKQARVPVQVVYIEADSAFLGKRWPLWKAPELPVHYRLSYGPSIEPLTDTASICEQTRAAYVEHFKDRPNPLV